MAEDISSKDLVIHVLNVGFGDNILIEFPANGSGKRSYGIVDCYSSKKTKSYLDKLIPDPSKRSRLAFVCATHPHSDHMMGIKSILEDTTYQPLEFWDSGFRHKSDTYRKILNTLNNEKIDMIRVSSGMERYFGKVRLTVLAPSVVLRNKYDTYGIDMNNSSVVLRLEHHGQDALEMRSQEYRGDMSLEAVRSAGKSVVILAGDAEFDSWAQVSHEYPRVERSSTHKPLVKKMINYLACSVVKVAHHGSMHSSPLNIYEIMSPKLAIISTKQEQSTKEQDGVSLTRDMFPHQSATIALEECDAHILTTDGSYESKIKKDGKQNDPEMAHEGSIVVVMPPGGTFRSKKLDDKKEDVPDPPNKI